MNCIHHVDHNLNIEQIPEKVLLLMGETRAGKTTLFYYLLKKKLLLEFDKELNISLMKPELLYFNAKIGNSYDSTTVYPNIPPQTDDGCLVIDLPGTPLPIKASTTHARSTGYSISTSFKKPSKRSRTST